MAKRVIAVLCSDIHLSHIPPVARSAEPNWYEAQGRMLKQLKETAKDYGDVPILCTGDIFHRYNPPPELINWAIKHLPKMYAVCGQHDLPYHDYNEKSRSAYMTMVLTENVIDVSAWEGGSIVKDNNLINYISIWGVPWAAPIEFADKSFRNSSNVLLCHKYIWIRKHGGYPGAPVEDLVDNMVEQLKGYDTAVFGDNHIPFTAMAGDCVVRNCGFLIPRTQNERDMLVEVGLLMEDGTVTVQKLDTSQDKWIDPDDTLEVFEDCKVWSMDEFIAELKNSADESSIDYKEAVERFIKDEKVDKQTADILYSALEAS